MEIREVISDLGIVGVNRNLTGIEQDKASNDVNWIYKGT